MKISLKLGHMRSTTFEVVIADPLFYIFHDRIDVWLFLPRRRTNPLCVIVPQFGMLYLQGLGDLIEVNQKVYFGSSV
jgi:hypothetical protein